MPDAAKIIDLDAWRDRHVLANCVDRAPRPFGWSTLAMLNSSLCRRDAVQTYARLELHPILIHGIEENGTCTCGRSACTAQGKHPVHAGWQTAALDVARLDSALIENFRLNIGLRMGMQPSGFRLITIDVDGPRSLLDPLEAVHGALPPTLTASSGKGLHLIYRLRDGAETPKNRVKLSPGVDVRSEAGQIVAAPSIHVSGRRYQWIDAREPAVLP